jgi:hypothetical protein
MDAHTDRRGLRVGRRRRRVAYDWLHPLGPTDREKRNPVLIPKDKPHLTSAVRKAEIEFDAGADLTANFEIERQPPET